MSVNSVVKAGDRIILVKLENHRPVSERKYNSRIIELLDYDTATISVPTDEGRVIPLSIGAVYRMSYSSPEGLFTCECEVLDRFRDKDTFKQLIKFHTVFERVQRREYFRIDIIRDFDIMQVKKEDEIVVERIRNNNTVSDADKSRSLLELGDFFTVKSIDISGGGIRFLSDRELDNNGLLLVYLEFETVNKLYRLVLPAVIIDYTIDRERMRFEYRIRFKDLKRTERESIIRYLFEEERKRRHKYLK